MNNQTIYPTYSITSKMKRYSIIQDDDATLRSSFYSSIRPNYAFTSGDSVYTVEIDCQFRSDLISLKFYNTTIFDWVLEDINNIRDPIGDLVVGKQLFIPSTAKINYLIS
jgi:hypothetical protein